MMPMLVSLGHNGSRDWLTPELGQPYANRYDMSPMLPVGGRGRATLRAAGG
jgi:hypothetical protein